MKRSNIKWIVLLSIIVTVGILLAVALGNSAGSEDGFLSGGVVRSDTATVLVILILSVPALLVGLLLVMLFAKDKPETIKANFDGVLNASVGKGKSDDEEEITERFCMLSEIERNKNNYGQFSYDKDITLEKLCEDFRNYAASKLKLYYDIEDIRRFISGTSASSAWIRASRNASYCSLSMAQLI